MASAERNLVFISYAHQDEMWCNAFRNMLAPASSIVSVWDDGLILVGENWAHQIEAALDRASVGLLLVTPNFLRSPFITTVELQRLLDAAATRGASIHWVPVSPSLFNYTALVGIQAGWDPERPLEGLSESDRNKAIYEICTQIVAKFGVGRPMSKDSRERLRDQVQVRLGSKYSITGEISSGKFSVLYRAQRDKPKHEVAIKAFTASEFDEWARKEYAECVERALMLSSATFIRISDWAMDESPEYLVSELVTGERMNEFLRHYPEGVSLATAKSILLDLAIGIAEIHNLGWRRGELCPSDILIQPTGSGRMSSVNFSNVLREQGSLTGNFLVDRESLSYMTPERFYGNPVTAATDQYSLALLASELLSGQEIDRVMHPCDLASREMLYAKLQSGHYEWASRSPEFAGVVGRMLRVNPEERWPSMSEVVERLRDIEVTERPQEVARKRATSGYLQILSAHGVEGEREFYRKFYRNFFASAPDMEAKFKGIDMERQYKVLNLAIYWLLEFRHDSPVAVRQLDQLAQRHARLGLEPRHYELFLEAFMKTLVDYESNALGLEAWRSTLTNGINFMLECVKTTGSE